MLSHDEYADMRTQDIPDYLRELSEETQRDIPVANMISGKVAGRFLSMLSKLVRPKCILELGTYTGYSALCLAEGLVKGGILHTIEHHERLIPFAQRYFDRSGLGDRIVLHHGDILEIMPKLSGPFDLVFIDADKPNYDKYLEAVFPKTGLQRVDHCGQCFLERSCTGPREQQQRSNPGNDQIRGKDE